MLKIYFYRAASRTNVIEKWEGAFGAPRVGERVALGGADFAVVEVRWWGPQPDNTQAVDIYVIGPVAPID
jgi:hypothetical protein